jgi:hypothetical protein
MSQLNGWATGLRLGDAPNQPVWCRRLGLYTTPSHVRQGRGSPGAKQQNRDGRNLDFQLFVIRLEQLRHPLVRFGGERLSSWIGIRHPQIQSEWLVGKLADIGCDFRRQIIRAIGTQASSI